MFLTYFNFLCHLGCFFVFFYEMIAQKKGASMKNQQIVLHILSQTYNQVRVLFVGGCSKARLGHVYKIATVIYRNLTP